MREAIFIKRDQLFKLYAGSVPLFIDAAGGEVTLQEGVDSEIEVLLRKSCGIYALVTPRLLFDLSYKLIVPTELLFTTTIESEIDVLRNLLEAHHPGRHCELPTPMDLNFIGSDIGPDGSSNRTVFCIWYPEITITNSIGLSHTIHDLLVYFSIKTSGGIVGRLYGQRVNQTKLEIVKGYRHSHLHKGDSTSYRRDGGLSAFCIGSTSIFSSMLQSVKEYTTKDRLEAFLLSLTAYLEWESLEGTPYTSICSLHTQSKMSVAEQVTVRLNEEDLTAVTTELLELLSAPQFSSCFIEFQPGLYFFDYTSDQCRLYDLEMRVLARVGDRLVMSIMHAPDLGYLSRTGPAVIEPAEELSEQGQYVVDKLGIPLHQYLPGPPDSTDNDNNHIRRIHPLLWYSALTMFNLLMIYEREIYEERAAIPGGS